MDTEAGPTRTGDPEARLHAAEQRLAVPVVLAALASIPAVFLSMAGPPLGTVGNLLNLASLTVLTAETVILFVLAADRWAWLRRHWYLVAVTLLALGAVIFAVGPLQLLRLVRFVGAVRILRVSRILKAGRILHRRSGSESRLRAIIAAAVSVLAAVFVAFTLTDPTTPTRQLIERAPGTVRLWQVLLAGLVLAVATVVVLLDRGSTGGPHTSGTEDDAAPGS